MSTHNLCFEQEFEKYQKFLSENYSFFFPIKFPIYFNRRVFIMDRTICLENVNKENLIFYIPSAKFTLVIINTLR